MNIEKIEELLNSYPKFIVKGHKSEEYYSFKNYQLFVNDDPYANYQIVEESDKFNLEITSNLLFKVENYKIDVEGFTKDVYLNYNESQLSNREKREGYTEYGHFVLIPEG